MSLLAAPLRAEDPFAAAKRQKIDRCFAIPATDYSTAMIFNPPGFETLYERSYCFQNLAVAERDVALADVVVNEGLSGLARFLMIRHADTSRAGFRFLRDRHRRALVRGIQHHESLQPSVDAGRWGIGAELDFLLNPVAKNRKSRSFKGLRLFSLLPTAILPGSGAGPPLPVYALRRNNP